MGISILFHVIFDDGSLAVAGRRNAGRYRSFLRRSALIGLAVGTLWAQNGTFEAGVYPVMEKAGCRACHNAPAFP